MHLPAAAASDQIEIALLVDKDLSRAQALAEQYGVPAVANDYHDAVGQAQAAVVALPSHLHAPAALAMLRGGLHVLVEKPMGISAQQCADMIEAARQADRTLAVGLVRRFYDSSQLVRRILQDGWLGKVHSFDCREGTIYRWAIQTDSRFRKEISGGGVLIDLGVHVLDLMLWWMGGYRDEPEALAYQDDARGGVEANCEIHLTLQSGVSGVIELSRTRDLRNTWIIRGERGALHIGIDNDPVVRLVTRDGDLVLDGRALPAKADEAEQTTMRAVFGRQLDDFASSCLERRQPMTPGVDGRRVISLIEACYARRQPLEQPWMLPEAPGFRDVPHS
jgi:predicted dehydrogenase